MHAITERLAGTFWSVHSFHFLLPAGSQHSTHEDVDTLTKCFQFNWFNAQVQTGMHEVVRQCVVKFNTVSKVWYASNLFCSLLSSFSCVTLQNGMEVHIIRMLTWCYILTGFSFGNRKPLLVLGVCLLAGLICKCSTLSMSQFWNQSNQRGSKTS